MTPITQASTHVAFFTSGPSIVALALVFMAERLVLAFPPHAAKAITALRQFYLHGPITTARRNRKRLAAERRVLRI